jgi:hypothetical protein
MADQYIFDKIITLAVQRYNTANPTATITLDQAYRAIVVGLESLLTSTNVAAAASVTDRM